jgi:anti-repressor protein|nr:MAG TPA: KilAC domain protein [Caudoviricetes sp.]
MNELIKVDFSGDRPAVSARELHEFLEVGTKYADWFPRMCEYGFSEGEDFNLLKNEQVRQEGNRMVSRMVDDAVLSIDMAKEICMIQRNENGKLARQYFLQMEKAWNSPEKVMARALQIADRKIKALEEENAVNRPKVLFADSVAASKTSILVGELAKLLKQNGVDTGQNRLFDWMRNNGYLIRRAGTDYNMPTQRSMEMGLFEIKETSVTHADGHVTVNKTPKVTGKGQQFFINEFLGR